MPTSDPSDLAVIDTNVLVYALHPESEHHAACRQLLDEAQDGKHQLAITGQVLAEFYAIVTDSRRVAQPRQPADALDAIEQLLSTDRGPDAGNQRRKDKRFTEEAINRRWPA